MGKQFLGWLWAGIFSVTGVAAAAEGADLVRRNLEWSAGTLQRIRVDLQALCRVVEVSPPEGLAATFAALAAECRSGRKALEAPEVPHQAVQRGMALARRVGLVSHRVLELAGELEALRARGREEEEDERAILPPAAARERLAGLQRLVLAGVDLTLARLADKPLAAAQAAGAMRLARLRLELLQEAAEEDAAFRQLRRELELVMQEEGVALDLRDLDNLTAQVRVRAKACGALALERQAVENVFEETEARLALLERKRDRLEEELAELREAREEMVDAHFARLEGEDDEEIEAEAAEEAGPRREVF